MAFLYHEVEFGALLALRNGHCLPIEQGEEEEDGVRPQVLRTL